MRNDALFYFCLRTITLFYPEASGIWFYISGKLDKSKILIDNLQNFKTGSGRDTKTFFYHNLMTWMQNNNL